jgi:uncharacterized membrane protein YccC
METPARDAQEYRKAIRALRTIFEAAGSRYWGAAVVTLYVHAQAAAKNNAWLKRQLEELREE